MTCIKYATSQADDAATALVARKATVAQRRDRTAAANESHVRAAARLSAAHVFIDVDDAGSVFGELSGTEDAAMYLTGGRCLRPLPTIDMARPACTGVPRALSPGIWMSSNLQ